MYAPNPLFLLTKNTEYLPKYYKSIQMNIFGDITNWLSSSVTLDFHQSTQIPLHSQDPLLFVSYLWNVEGELIGNTGAFLYSF